MTLIRNWSRSHRSTLPGATCQLIMKGSAMAISSGRQWIIPQTEAEFQRVVTEYAEQHGWDWMHVGRTGKYSPNGAKGTLGKGWPDLLLIRGRRIIFLELKAQTGEVSTEQKRVLPILQKAAETYVCRPSDLPFLLQELT